MIRAVVAPPLFSLEDRDVPRRSRRTAALLREARAQSVGDLRVSDDLEERTRAAIRRAKREAALLAVLLLVALICTGLLLAAGGGSGVAGLLAFVFAVLLWRRTQALRALPSLAGPWREGQLVLLRVRRRSLLVSRLPYLLADGGGVPVRDTWSWWSAPGDPGPVLYRGAMRGRRACLVVAAPDRIWVTSATGAIPYGWQVVVET